MIYFRDGPCDETFEVPYPAGFGKLPVGLVPSRSTKESSTWPRVTWRGAEGNGMRVLARVFVTELMAGSGRGRLRKALFRRKGDEARNYGFAFIEVDEGPYLPRTGEWGGEGRLVYWGLRRGYWNICFLPYVRGKLSMKAIDCLIVRKIWEWLYCPFVPPFFALK